MIFAGLELHCRARRNHETAAGLIRIATDARFRQARLKNAEIAQLHRDIVGQAVGDVIERSLHHFKDLVLHHSGLIADRDDDVPLCKLPHIHNGIESRIPIERAISKKIEE